MADDGLVYLCDIGVRVVYYGTVYVGDIFSSVSGDGVVCDCVFCIVVIFFILLDGFIRDSLVGT